MANYSSQYIPDFATLTAPLRELTKKNARFVWNTAHEHSFKKLTAALATSPCMAYFDKDKQTSVVVDASPVGFLLFYHKIPPDMMTIRSYLMQAEP